MVHRLNKMFRLSIAAGRKCISQPSEALLLLRMAWWVSVLSATARVFPLPRALEIVSGPRSMNTPNYDKDTPIRLARSIDALLSADVLHFKPKCWKRAAVLRRYLSRNGIVTTIQFGVRNEEIGKVDGHAWLELDGKPFLETVPPDYVVTYTFPTAESYRTEEALFPSD